jgi:hypothetical protein
VVKILRQDIKNGIRSRDADADPHRIEEVRQTPLVTMLVARMTRAAMGRTGRRACIVQARAGPAASFHATFLVGAKKSKKEKGKGKGSSSSSSSTTTTSVGNNGGGNGADEVDLAFADDDDYDFETTMHDDDDGGGGGGGGGGGQDDDEGPQLPDLAKLGGRMSDRVTRFVEQLKRIRGGNNSVANRSKKL